VAGRGDTRPPTSGRSPMPVHRCRFRRPDELTATSGSAPGSGPGPAGPPSNEPSVSGRPSGYRRVPWSRTAACFPVLLPRHGRSAPDPVGADPARARRLRLDRVTRADPFVPDPGHTNGGYRVRPRSRRMPPARRCVVVRIGGAHSHPRVPGPPDGRGRLPIGCDPPDAEEAPNLAPCLGRRLKYAVGTVDGSPTWNYA